MSEKRRGGKAKEGEPPTPASWQGGEKGEVKEDELPTPAVLGASRLRASTPPKSRAALAQGGDRMDA
jgi:hypothetical protein